MGLGVFVKLHFLSTALKLLNRDYLFQNISDSTPNLKTSEGLPDIRKRTPFMCLRYSIFVY